MNAFEIIEAYSLGQIDPERSGILHMEDYPQTTLQEAFMGVRFNMASIMSGVYLWVWMSDYDLPFSESWTYRSCEGCPDGETIYLYRIENV
jgi:hypothetical protein